VLILLDPVDQCITAKGATRLERLLTALHSWRLDHDLAAGASPEASAQLALRGLRLVRLKERRALARSLRRLLEEAGRPQPRLFRSASPIRADRVAQVHAELARLEERLLTPGPVSAQGMAQVNVLLTDGTGPLYQHGGCEVLRRRVLEAINALDPLHDW